MVFRRLGNGAQVMGPLDWLLLAGWVALLVIGWTVAVRPGRGLDRATREAIRRSVPVRHEKRRDKRSGG
jgi:hypothetical protein